ncbi:pyridoxamine 5'-phosphate oxidase [Synechococcus sp. 8F6]|uniref:pyridoxamine 5'-phosphate oxidase n=1 Tax=Synechococcus sp. 8F6 TaxID=2025606 RepID=UPI000B997F80|nr:pyridoxamine 5'-phosphate oxidase [Synechococcus sp. 8F6]
MTGADERVDLGPLRRDYGRATLRRSDLHPDPVEQFRCWFEEAVEANLLEPNAMVLGSVNGQRPSARTVLLKAFDARGFVFFTNTNSRKAQEIAAHPAVSLLFPWYGLERQCIILGRAERISLGDALAYFRSRPQGSRLGTWVSQQSRMISSRQVLEDQWRAITERFRQGEIPMPPAWGGYRVIPEELEVWQGGLHRLHDRFRYRRNGDTWLIERLAP